MKNEITTTEFARNQSEYLSRVAYRGESFVITKGKRRMAEIRPAQPVMRESDFAKAWDKLPHLDPEEAEDFAKDIQAGIDWLNSIPVENPWDR